MSVTELQQLPKPGTRMSVAEFQSLNLSEDSSLILLNGVVYDEDGTGVEMTKRSHRHARTELRIGRFLDEWLERTAFPATAFSGEVGCELPGQGFVGIDVAVFSNDVVAQSEGAPYIAGVPLLAVEVLSISDRHGAVTEKVANYLDVGVKQVWLVDCGFRSVTVFRPDKTQMLYSQNMSLDGGSELPGFTEPVRRFFE
ncbi:MAG TPA: Uma2 family endonuclease [Planctomycetaceae bacterium]|nr:Uma2 family endonuclease [Planctomycetaceae bacterium]HRA86782.1 Uma2 family endonuclease [Planctomycetaceae bacterium]